MVTTLRPVSRVRQAERQMKAGGRAFGVSSGPTGWTGLSLKSPKIELELGQQVQKNPQSWKNCGFRSLAGF